MYRLSAVFLCGPSWMAVFYLERDDVSKMGREVGGGIRVKELEGWVVKKLT
jgi:hypothetical protein